MPEVQVWGSPAPSRIAQRPSEDVLALRREHGEQIAGGTTELSGQAIGHPQGVAEMAGEGRVLEGEGRRHQ